MRPPPSFSIIVVCKNPGQRISTALTSVWEQHDVEKELIVIDGASTDGTVEWLEKNRREIAVLISEPDRGIYDAMNKGLARAQGDWVIFLGADDRFTNHKILSEALKAIEETGAGVVTGKAVYEDGRVYQMNDRPRPIARNFVHHQATFYRRAVFGENGGFDPSLAIMADYELNLRLWKSHVVFKTISLRVAVCGIAGASDAGTWRGYREEITVRHRYFAAPHCWLWDLGSVVRWVRKQFVRARRGKQSTKP